LLSILMPSSSPEPFLRIWRTSSIKSGTFSIAPACAAVPWRTQFSF
jgi:hypothetical protein